MITEKITYKDFTGTERTEEFHFNLTIAELTEIRFYNGGFEEYLARITGTGDINEILKAFKGLLQSAFGVKTIDGRNFIKREEDWLAFISSEAYSTLLMKLLADAEWAAAFFNGMLPSDLAERAAAQQRGEGIVSVPTGPRAPQDHLPKQTADIPTIRETSPVALPETPEQLRARIRAEIIAEQAAEQAQATPPVVSEPQTPGVIPPPLVQ